MTPWLEMLHEALSAERKVLALQDAGKDARPTEEEMAASVRALMQELGHEAFSVYLGSYLWDDMKTLDSALEVVKTATSRQHTPQTVIEAAEEAVAQAYLDIREDLDGFDDVSWMVTVYDRVPAPDWTGVQDTSATLGFAAYDIPCESAEDAANVLAGLDMQRILWDRVSDNDKRNQEDRVVGVQAAIACESVADNYCQEDEDAEPRWLFVADVLAGNH